MAKTNIVFNNNTYSIDDSALSTASAALRNHLSTVMNGSGAVVTLNGTSYNIDSAKLSAATTNFVSHLGTIAGSGYKVVVGGNEYKISSAKMTDAIGEIETVLGGLNSPNAGGSDTLTWDGNTDGLAFLDLDETGDSAYYLYCVSDAIVTRADVANGLTFSGVYNGEVIEEFIPAEGIDDGEGFLMLGDLAMFVYEDVIYGGYTVPKKGVYIPASFCAGHTGSLTIPGYNGFETTTTVVKKKGDTLTWDGNTDGRLIVNDAFVKISDVVLTSDDLENGYKFSYVFDGVTDERELTEYERPNNDILVICDGGVICVSTDGASIAEFVFPEKGTYIGIGYTEASPVSLTIHGYNGFETTTP